MCLCMCLCVYVGMCRYIHRFMHVRDVFVRVYMQVVRISRTNHTIRAKQSQKSQIQSYGVKNDCFTGKTNAHHIQCNALGIFVLLICRITYTEVQYNVLYGYQM